MKNINGKKGWPTIKDTSCLTCSFNELISIRLKRKNDLHEICMEYRDNIRQLADLELIDRCYVSRLHETHINHHLWLNEIHNINRLRNQNKQERLSCIHRITGLKQMIQRQSSLIHDLHNIIKDIYVKYNGEKYQNFKYNLRLTTYSDGQKKFDAVALRPIQFVGIPDNAIHERFEPIKPGVTVTEKVSSQSI